jgi:hypothetical protein
MDTRSDGCISLSSLRDRELPIVIAKVEAAFIDPIRNSGVGAGVEVSIGSADTALAQNLIADVDGDGVETVEAANKSGLQSHTGCERVSEFIDGHRPNIAPVVHIELPGHIRILDREAPDQPAEFVVIEEAVEQFLRSAWVCKLRD